MVNSQSVEEINILDLRKKDAQNQGVRGRPRIQSAFPRLIKDKKTSDPKLTTF